MSISYTSNASIAGSTRTKVLDVYLQQGIALSALSLSSQSGDPIWEIFLDKMVSDLPSPASPTLAASTTGGSLPRNSTYFVRVSCVDANGLESPASDTLKKVTTGATTDTNKITVTIASVAGASSYNIYMGTTPGGEILVGSSVSTSFVITGVPSPDAIRPPCDPSIQISSQKNKLDSIPMTGSQLVVGYRITVWVTASASATTYVSIIGV